MIKGCRVLRLMCGWRIGDSILDPFADGLRCWVYVLQQHALFSGLCFFLFHMMVEAAVEIVSVSHKIALMLLAAATAAAVDDHLLLLPDSVHR